MAEFVRAQIFGTCFEITSRYIPHSSHSALRCNYGFRTPHFVFCMLTSVGMLTFNQLEWEPLDSYGMDLSHVDVWC